MACAMRIRAPRLQAAARVLSDCVVEGSIQCRLQVCILGTPLYGARMRILIHASDLLKEQALCCLSLDSFCL